jgi:hypothetical protein
VEAAGAAASWDGFPGIGAGVNANKIIAESSKNGFNLVASSVANAQNRPRAAVCFLARIISLFDGLLLK